MDEMCEESSKVDEHFQAEVAALEKYYQEIENKITGTKPMS